MDWVDEESGEAPARISTPSAWSHGRWAAYVLRCKSLMSKELQRKTVITEGDCQIVVISGWIS